MSQFATAFVLKIIRLTALLLLFLLVKTTYGPVVEPQSQTVNLGDTFFFQCTNPDITSPPTWIINGVHKFPSQLPPNLCVNSTGLVGVATKGLNQSTFQCSFVVLTLIGGVLSPAITPATPVAVLTVLPGVLLGDDNLIIGTSPPLILDFKYNTSSQGLYLQLDPVAGVDKYNIQTFNCSGGMLQEVKINSTCSAANITNAEVPDTGLTLVAVQNCNENISCGESADIDSKNIVAINSSDPDTIPEPTQEITYTPGSAVCLFQSKLYPFVPLGGILAITLKAGGQHRRYHFFRDLPVGFQTNQMFQLCLVHQDIRTPLFEIFGIVTSIDVIEDLEFSNICEQSNPATVKLFGRSTRVIFTQSPENDSVLPSQCRTTFDEDNISASNITAVPSNTVMVMPISTSSAVPTISSSSAGNVTGITVNSLSPSSEIHVINTGGIPRSSVVPTSPTRTIGIIIGVLFLVVVIVIACIILVAVIVVSAHKRREQVAYTPEHESRTAAETHDKESKKPGTDNFECSTL